MNDKFRNAGIALCLQTGCETIASGHRPDFPPNFGRVRHTDEPPQVSGPAEGRVFRPIEGEAVDWPVEHKGCHDAANPEGGNEGGGFPWP